MNIIEQYDQNLKMVFEKINTTQTQNMIQAAQIIANTTQNKGIIHSFGSGHSYAAALEIAGRAGGYINSKAISSFSGPHGILEVVPGVGKAFTKHLDVRVGDCFIIISNSARNPLHLEFADFIKKQEVKLILITNEETARGVKTINEHSQNLWELADVVIDNCGFTGDCSITLKNTDIAVGPTSSLAVSYILNKVILLSYEECLKQNITPPVYMSANIDGGREYNLKLQKQYKERLRKI